MQQINIASLIFPPIHPFPEIFGQPRTRNAVLRQIQNDSDTNNAFLALSPLAQEAFLGFCMGNRGLKVTYDPFFQHIFNPELYPERLNRLLSCIMGQPVVVWKTLSRERHRLSEDSSLIIMDILVELADKRLVNLEMQRIGYEFPIERSSCYCADLLVRQYDLVKQLRRTQGKDFSYRDIKPVYVIVFMEKSPNTFLSHPDQYIHRSCFSFDTGLEVEPMQNFVYVSLDIFRKLKHNSLTELEAWLYFLGSDDPADILRIIRRYPFFQELYHDIVKFRFQPKELIAMFSDALRILDQNTVKYMIDELKEELSRKDSELSKKDTLIASLLSEIEHLKKQ